MRRRWAAVAEDFRFVDVEASLTTVLDLTDRAVQKRYRVTRAQVLDDDWTACQELAHRLRADGVVAVRTYSAADVPHGRQVVIFLENLKDDSTLRVVAVREIDRDTKPER